MLQRGLYCDSCFDKGLNARRHNRRMSKWSTTSKKGRLVTRSNPDAAHAKYRASISKHAKPRTDRKSVYAKYGISGKAMGKGQRRASLLTGTVQSKYGR